MMGQLARVGTGGIDLRLDEEKVVLEAVEVVVDEFGADKDLGAASGNIGGETYYATTPLTASPMVGDSGAASPFYDGDGAFSPAYSAASFLPAYSPDSGSYGSGFQSGSYGSDHGGASPQYSPTRYVITEDELPCEAAVFLSDRFLTHSQLPSRFFSFLSKLSLAITSLRFDVLHNCFFVHSSSYSPTSPQYNPTSPAYSPTRYGRAMWSTARSLSNEQITTALTQWLTFSFSVFF